LVVSEEALYKADNNYNHTALFIVIVETTVEALVAAATKE